MSSRIGPCMGLKPVQRLGSPTLLPRSWRKMRSPYEYKYDCGYYTLQVWHCTDTRSGRARYEILQGHARKFTPDAVPRKFQTWNVSRAWSSKVHSETDDRESQRGKGKKDAPWGFEKSMAWRMSRTASTCRPVLSPLTRILEPAVIQAPQPLAACRKR